MNDEISTATERGQYDSDLTDEQWSVVAPMLPPANRGGRPRKTDPREVVNALLYAARSGCSWRALPRDLPPWQTVYTYYRAWKSDGTLERIHAAVLAQTDEPGASL